MNGWPTWQHVRGKKRRSTQQTAGLQASSREQMSRAKAEAACSVENGARGSGSSPELTTSPRTGGSERRMERQLGHMNRQPGDWKHRAVHDIYGKTTQPQDTQRDIVGGLNVQRTSKVSILTALNSREDTTALCYSSQQTC